MTTITRPSPLSEYDRRLLTIAASKAEDIQITPNDIWTIYIDGETNIFWIYCRDSRKLPFDREQFKTAIDAAKPELAAQLQAEIIAKRNTHKSAAELSVGDRIKFDSSFWTVTSVKSQRVSRQYGRGDLHTNQFNISIFDGIQTQVLKPLAHVNYELAA